MSVRSDFIAAVKFFDTLSEHWDQLKMVGSETSEQPSKSYRAQELAEVFAGNYNLVPKSELKDSSNVLSQNIVDRELFETLPKERQKQVNHFLKTQRQNLIKKTIAATQLVVDVLDNSSEKDFNLAFKNLNRGYYSKSSQQISSLFKNIKAYQGNFNVNNFMACADLVVHGYLPLLRNYKNSSNYDNQLVSNMAIDQRMSLVAVVPYLKQSTKKRTVVIQGGVQERIVPKIVEKTKYVEVVKYAKPEEEMNLDVDLVPTMMGGTLNSNTYITELHSMQIEFNTKYMELYERLISKLEAIDVENLKDNTTIDMINVVRMLETIMVSSGKTLTYISGLIRHKDINTTYTNECKRFKQLIQQFDVFKDIVPVISGFIDLCQNIHKKYTELSTKYINTPKTSTEIYNGERKFSDEMPKITFNKSLIIRKNDLINKLYSVISSVKNLSFENTLTKNVLKDYIGDKDIRKKAINEYFDNYVNSVKFSMSSIPINRELTYIKPFVDMKLTLIAQARQSYHWLNEKLDTFLVQQRLEQLGNKALDSKTLQSIADAYINFNKYYKVTWRSIAEKYEKFGDAETVTSFFKLFKLAKQTFEEVDAFTFLEKMYRSIGINIDNFPEFKSKLIDYLCINMIWFDVYEEDEDGKFRIADIDDLKIINEEGINFDEKYNLNNCAYQKLNEILNLNDLTTSFKINNQYTNYGLVLKNIIEHGNVAENKMLIGYSMRFPSAVIADFEDFNTYVIESLYTPLLQIVDKYIAQRYDGNYDLNMNINMMMQGGDEKEQGGSIYDIVPDHIPKSEIVRKDCVKLYLSVYTIVNFYIRTYVANNIEGITFRISKFSPFYAFKDEFDNHLFNIESDRTMDKYLELCHKFYDSVFGKTIDERNDKAVELVIHDLNSMLLFANDELMLRSRVDSSGSDTMLEVRFKEIRKTMQESLMTIGTNMFKNGKFTNSYIDKFFETSIAKIESTPDHMKKSALIKIIGEIDSDSDVNKISDETKSYLDLCVAPMYIISNAYMTIIEDIVRHIDGFNRLENHDLPADQRVQFGKAKLLALVMMSNVSLETKQKEFFFSIIETYYKQCDEIFHNLMNFPGLSDESIQNFYNEYHEGFKAAINDLKNQISDNLRNRDTLKVVDITSEFRSLFRDRVNIPTILDNHIVNEFNALINKYEYAKEPIGYQIFDPKWNSTFTEFVLTVLGYVGQNLAAPVEFVEELINSRLNGNTFEEIIATSKQVAKNSDIAFLKESLEKYNLASILVAIGMNSRNRDRTTISGMSQTMINKYLAVIPFLVYVLEKCKTLFVGNHTYYTYLNRLPTRRQGDINRNEYHAIINMRGENVKAINAKTEIQILLDLLNTFYINLGTYADEHQFGTSIESTKSFEHSLSEIRLLVSKHNFDLISFMRNIERYEWILPRCIPKEYIKSAKYDRFKALIDKHYIVTTNPTFKQSLHNTLDVIAKTLLSLLLVKLNYVTITTERPVDDFRHYHERHADVIDDLNRVPQQRLFGGKNEVGDEVEDKITVKFNYICNLLGIPSLKIDKDSDLYGILELSMTDDIDLSSDLSVIKYILNRLFSNLDGIHLLETIEKNGPLITTNPNYKYVKNEDNNIILQNIQVTDQEMINSWIKDNMDSVKAYNSIIQNITPQQAWKFIKDMVYLNDKNILAGSGVGFKDFKKAFSGDKSFPFVEYNSIDQTVKNNLFIMMINRMVQYVKTEDGVIEDTVADIVNLTYLPYDTISNNLMSDGYRLVKTIREKQITDDAKLVHLMTAALYSILEPVLLENTELKPKDFIILNGAQFHSLLLDNGMNNRDGNYNAKYKKFSSTLLPENIAMIFKYLGDDSQLGEIVENYLGSKELEEFIKNADSKDISQEIKYVYSQLQMTSFGNITYDKAGVSSFFEKLTIPDIVYIYILLIAAIKKDIIKEDEKTTGLIATVRSIIDKYEKISTIHNSIMGGEITLLRKTLKGGAKDDEDVLLFETFVQLLEMCHESDEISKTFVFNTKSTPTKDDYAQKDLTEDEIKGFFEELQFSDIDRMISMAMGNDKHPHNIKYPGNFEGVDELDMNMQNWKILNNGFMHLASFASIEDDKYYHNGETQANATANKVITHDQFSRKILRFIRAGAQQYTYAIEYQPRISSVRLRFKHDAPLIYLIKESVNINNVEYQAGDLICIYEITIALNSDNIKSENIDHMSVIISRATHIPNNKIPGYLGHNMNLIDAVFKDDSLGDMIRVSKIAHEDLFKSYEITAPDESDVSNTIKPINIFDIFNTFAGFITEIVRGNTDAAYSTDGNGLNSQKRLFGTEMLKAFDNSADGDTKLNTFSVIDGGIMSTDNTTFACKLRTSVIKNDHTYTDKSTVTDVPNYKRFKEMLGPNPATKYAGRFTDHPGYAMLDLLSRCLFTQTQDGICAVYDTNEAADDIELHELKYVLDGNEKIYKDGTDATKGKGKLFQDLNQFNGKTTVVHVAKIALLKWLLVKIYDSIVENSKPDHKEDIKAYMDQIFFAEGFNVTNPALYDPAYVNFTGESTTNNSLKYEQRSSHTRYVRSYSDNNEKKVDLNSNHLRYLDDGNVFKKIKTEHTYKNIIDINIPRNGCWEPILLYNLNHQNNKKYCVYTPASTGFTGNPRFRSHNIADSGVEIGRVNGTGGDTAGNLKTYQKIFALDRMMQFAKDNTPTNEFKNIPRRCDDLFEVDTEAYTLGTYGIYAKKLTFETKEVVHETFTIGDLMMNNPYITTLKQILNKYIPHLCGDDVLNLFKDDGTSGKIEFTGITITDDEKAKIANEFKYDMEVFIQGIINGYVKRKLFGETTVEHKESLNRETKNILNELSIEGSGINRFAKSFGQIALKHETTQSGVPKTITLPKVIYKYDRADYDDAAHDAKNFRPDPLTGVNQVHPIIFFTEGTDGTPFAGTGVNYLSYDGTNVWNVMPGTTEVYEYSALVSKVWDDINDGIIDKDSIVTINNTYKNMVKEAILYEMSKIPSERSTFVDENSKKHITFNIRDVKNAMTPVTRKLLNFDLIQRLFIKNIYNTHSDTSIIKPTAFYNIDTINIDFNNVSFGVLKFKNDTDFKCDNIFTNDYALTKQLDAKISSKDLIKKIYSQSFGESYQEKLEEVKNNTINKKINTFAVNKLMIDDPTYSTYGTDIDVTYPITKELLKLISINFDCLPSTNRSEIMSGLNNWHITKNSKQQLLNEMFNNANFSNYICSGRILSKKHTDLELEVTNNLSDKDDVLKKKLDKSSDEIYKQAFIEMTTMIDRIITTLKHSIIAKTDTYDRNNLKFIFSIFSKFKSNADYPGSTMYISGKAFNEPFENLYRYSTKVKQFRDLMNKGYYNFVYGCFNSAMDDILKTYKLKDRIELEDITSSFYNKFEQAIKTEVDSHPNDIKTLHLLRYMVPMKFGLNFNNLNTFIKNKSCIESNKGDYNVRMNFNQLKPMVIRTGYGTNAMRIDRLPGYRKMLYISDRTCTINKEQNTPLFSFNNTDPINKNNVLLKENINRYIRELNNVISSLGSSNDDTLLREHLNEVVKDLNLNNTNGIGSVIKNSAEAAWFPTANNNRSSQAANTNTVKQLKITDTWTIQQIHQFINSIIETDHAKVKDKMTIPGKETGSGDTNKTAIDKWKKDFMLFKDILNQPTARDADLGTNHNAAVTADDKTCVKNLSAYTNADLIKRYNSIIMYCCVASIPTIGNSITFAEYWNRVLNTISTWIDKRFNVDSDTNREAVSYFEHVSKYDYNGQTKFLNDISKYKIIIDGDLRNSINSTLAKLYGDIETIRVVLKSSEKFTAPGATNAHVYYLCKLLESFKELQSHYHILIDLINVALEKIEPGSKNMINMIKFIRDINAYFSFDSKLSDTQFNMPLEKQYLLPIDTIQSFPRVSSYSWLDTIEKIENRKSQADFHYVKSQEKLRLISERVSKEFSKYESSHQGYSVIKNIMDTLEYFILKSNLKFDFDVDTTLYYIKPFTKSLYRFASTTDYKRTKQETLFAADMPPDEVFNIFMRAVLNTQTMKKLNFLDKSPKPQIMRTGLALRGGDLDESDTTSLTNEAYYGDSDHQTVEPLIGLIDDDHRSRKEGIIAYYNKALLSFNSFFTKNIFAEIIYNSALFDSGIKKIHEELLNHIGDEINEGMMTYWTRMIDAYVGKQPSYDFSKMANIKRPIEYEDEGVYGENYGIDAIQPSMNNNFYLKTIATHDDVIKKVYEVINESQGTNMIKTLLKIDACNTIVGVLLQFLKTFSFRNVDYNANEPYSSNATSVEPFDIDRF